MAAILVAEDDPNGQLLIQARLKAYFDVVVASDGQQALDLIGTRAIDLLIADVMMPKLNGFDLVKTLRRQGHEKPVLILTARQSLGDKHTGLQAGGDDYMTKPVQYEELLWRVQALLRRAKIHTSKEIRIGGVVLDSTSYCLRKGELAISFPTRDKSSPRPSFWRPCGETPGRVERTP